jgi:hypothetical protein
MSLSRLRLNDWDRVEAISEIGATSWLIDMANGYMAKRN